MPCEGALGSLGKLISRSGLVIAYAACSASMLLVNKWALLHFPLPASLTFLQLASTAAVVVLVQLAGMVTIDEVSWAQVWAFMPVPMLFALALYSSTQLLHNSDAGLQILIRTTTPALVCVGDYLFMGYDLPSMRSMAALVGLMVGAAFYFRIETAISSSAIFWGCFYLVSISVEMVCVKSVLNHVRMGTWTRVLINNLITALILAPVCFLTDERQKLAKLVVGEVRLTPIGLTAVATSCVAGVWMSFAGFALRESVSATTFTFVGVVCKFATVLANQLVWTHHGSTTGALVLCASIVLSTIYVAPKKRAALAAVAEPDKSHAASGDEEEADAEVYPSETSGLMPRSDEQAAASGAEKS